MSGQRFAEYGRPRRVDGGLRARSTRGAIGQSWWSRRFLAVLESFALGTRLTRGRSYARAGQVLALDVTPGRVSASVQGSAPRPYRVGVELATFDEPVWARIEALLAGQALFSARLLAGDLPPELEEILATAGAPLFPSALDELTMHCACPDFAVPCKHLAATFYLLAEAFDADPFQLLHWRGRSRQRLLGRLRELRTAAGVPAAAATASRVDVPADPAGTAAALAGLAPTPRSGSPDRFWAAPVPLPARPPTLRVEPDLLLRQLGPADPTIGGPGLVDRLSRAYHRFGDGPVERVETDRDRR